MIPITLDIREDLSHPEGGHAVIRIKGLKAKPDNGAFVIEPARGSLAGSDMKGWPRGARRPLKTTMSDTGFEIVVGPDVVENPVLLPGTPVVIKVPAAGVSLEALWPDITPLRRKKVKRIITSSERREAAARAQSNITKLDVGARASRDNQKSAGSSNERRTPSNLDYLPLGQNTPPPLNRGAESSTQLPSQLSGARGGGAQAATVGMQPQSVSHSIADDPLQELSTNRSDSVSTPVETARKPDLPDTQPNTKTAHTNDDAVPEQVPQFRELRSNDPTRMSLGAVLTGILLGMMLAALLSFAYVSQKGWPDLEAIGLGDGGLKAARNKPNDRLAVYDALIVGEISPRGIDAKTVSPQDAIRRADTNLRSGSGINKRDTTEGAFWLKQYLSRKMGGQQTLWALTQLGSTYAHPVDGAPDYKRAQALWEASSALGDPYAACFLGQLHEFGLGVSPSRELALTWYLRARASGGCHSLDQAISRLGG